ncbi:hypothetical protein BJY01DRAFT_254653 [Aspergillus pseudoustus]|uniref:Rhodopsin domain-containing protein n=1 Tax=Aspergillus pseudoustus TaxID=1810923 RepID=A0ABR4IRK5_9EURO
MAGESPIIVEAIAEFTLGGLITLLRLFSRWRLVGLKGWGGDEYFSILAVLCWTIEIVSVILVGRTYGSNTGWTDDERAAFDDATIRRLEIGSKLVFIGWFSYIASLWALKASMLFFYDRITQGLFEQKIVRGCAVYCAASFVGVFLAVIFHCRPLHKAWQVYPDPGRECTAGYTLYPIVLSLNVVSDFVLVGVPIPMLIKLQCNRLQKLIIGVLLCSGIFIVVAAFLRCILVLSSIDQINVAAIWAVRETFVAMVVVNAPALKPLFRLSTWSSKFGPKTSSDEYPLSSTGRARGSKHAPLKSLSRAADTYTFLESDVAIVPPNFEVEISGEAGDAAGKGSETGIKVTTNVETRYEEA